MLLNEIAYDQNSFKALIIAGPPASGKSTLYNMISLPKSHGYINTDTMRHTEARRLGLEGDLDRHEQTLIAGLKDELYKFLFQHIIVGSPLVFETVGNKKQTLDKRISILETLGYDVSMIYTYVPEEMAKELETERRKKENRSVDHTFISDVYQSMPTRLAEIADHLGKENFLYVPRVGIEYDPKDEVRIQQFSSNFFRRPLQNQKGIQFRKDMLATHQNLLKSSTMTAQEVIQLLSIWYHR